MHKKIRGRYAYVNKKFVSDQGMNEINVIIRKCKLLADNGPCIPSFYFDPVLKLYWKCTEYQDYSKELEQVNRKYIIKNFPTVELDNLLDVDYGENIDTD